MLTDFYMTGFSIVIVSEQVLDFLYHLFSGNASRIRIGSSACRSSEWGYTWVLGIFLLLIFIFWSANVGYVSKFVTRGQDV